MKGVILAGGIGARLHPFTYFVNKSILPVYDKPLIYFPIKSLIDAGVEDIVINTNSQEQIERVLSGDEFTASIKFHIEKEAKGLASALYDMKEIIKGKAVLVMLGDIYLPFQIAFPNGLSDCCIYLSTRFIRTRISEYGVAELSPENGVLNFEEKPSSPQGNHVHMGTTFFPEDLTDILEQMGPREGKNLTDIANIYHRKKRLVARVYNEPWFNVGTPEDLFLAAQYRRESISES